MDPQRTQAFGEWLLDLLTGNVLTMLIGIGHRIGLFEAAAECPATPPELAERAGHDERYVREWLGSMVTGLIFDYEPATERYTLPAEHVLLTGARCSRRLGSWASTWQQPIRADGVDQPAVVPVDVPCRRVWAG